MNTSQKVTRFSMLKTQVILYLPCMVSSTTMLTQSRIKPKHTFNQKFTIIHLPLGLIHTRLPFV